MPTGPPLLVYDNYVSCNLTSVLPFLFFSLVVWVWLDCLNPGLDSEQKVSVITSKSYFEADNTNEIRLLCSCIIEWVTIMTSLTTAIVSEHFWVAGSNVCKLQWRGLNTVDGGNLSATLSLVIRGLPWGQRSASVWRKMKALSRDHSTHAPTPTHTPSQCHFHYCSFVHLPLCTPSSTIWLSLNRSLEHICRRHNVCVRSLTFSSSRCSSLALPLTFSVLPSFLSLFFFLGALFDLFVLTFLFNQAHKPKPHPG